MDVLFDPTSTPPSALIKGGDSVAAPFVFGTVMMRLVIERAIAVDMLINPDGSVLLQSGSSRFFDCVTDAVEATREETTVDFFIHYPAKKPMVPSKNEVSRWQIRRKRNQASK